MNESKAWEGMPRVAEWLRRHSLATLIALIIIGSLRIVSTYTVFSSTYDEPAHLACGLEWLSKGSYQYEPLHPPLARVAAAIGPYLDGARSIGKPTMWEEGAAILAQGGHYERTLFLSRLGVLPFFWIACIVVHLWGRRSLGEPAASLAVLVFSQLPPVLAHAGLATTDMALAAMVGAAFLAGLNWCERPTTGASLIMGATTGLAFLSKFSALAFLPVAATAALACYVLTERPAASDLLRAARARLPGLCLAALLTFYVVWAGYRFSFGPTYFTHLRLPFPEFFAGVRQAALYEQAGAQYAYILGRHSDSGWWWYYIVVLAVKTPLSVFVLACGACVLALRKGAPRGLWMALAFSGGIFLFCMGNRIDLGVRHILPVYMGLSLLAAAGAMALLQQAECWRPARWVVAGSLLSLTVSSASAHPDYLPYFNLLAGSRPELVLIDSDLDWGQDLKRLSLRLQQAKATQLAFKPCLPLHKDLLGLPPLETYDFINPSPGWNAVRETVLQLMLSMKRSINPEAHFWAESIPPQERIGGGILLWYFPPEAIPPLPPGAASVSAGGC